ncbi:AraC family transcriptional regulator [Vulcanimicrobium alpinum]|uniref:AraC family transcriptional regulator n=1 Tax=Vulcanimicrobium alpinum TaxID=3016050 RepID=UPI00295F23A1|nr:AraC family transcriptional regulator [Vulcanimicrobium alpinum]
MSAVHIDDATPSWATLGPHRVRYATLAFFERGTTAVVLNGIERRFAPGDVVFVPPGSVADSDRAFTRRGTAWWSVAFDGASGAASPVGSATQRLLDRLAGVIPVEPESGIGRISVPRRDRNAWIDRLYRLRTELRRTDGDSADVVFALLTMLAVDAGRLAGTSTVERTGSPLLSQLASFVTANIDRSIGLRDVANALAFSPAYLTELLRRDTGRSVCEWILEFRVRRSEELLLDGGISIADVACAVGYDDARSFRRAFVRTRGVSPQAWRTGRAAIASSSGNSASVSIVRDLDGFRTSA